MKTLLILLLDLMLFKRRVSKSKSNQVHLNTSKPVLFPLLNSELHMGFVNSMKNDKGLQASFYVDDNNTVTCAWENTADHFQGFAGIIHGGVLASLADELMANCIVGHKQKFGVTLSSRFQWHSPVKVGENVRGSSRILAAYKHFLLLEVILENTSGKQVLSGTGLFYLPTAKQFKKMIGFDLPIQLLPYVRN
jgi:acyl-coenzyme A thioesterase PaaI-like protein